MMLKTFSDLSAQKTLNLGIQILCVFVVKFLKTSSRRELFGSSDCRIRESEQ